ncbi:four-carbon acid sugar kinase family protein [Fictibacillus phosphorivorans]|uniref:four-carbon acid sugar kinase family protein n=1 Tax=Fictibacillus phosphorivorans TaxID=1221500 RepID=UPI00204259A1|nr:four-carbon acid sugar kinase family protein [Fictibacillus phosphorivorans]MCM3717782.1 four-carbon acid sugar kinase family protein [Fictibacillus phosphorivorans]MCM3777010.1 four-carbon acid sugar kinase family protein [Fictibacillus phosphorivorans]
MIGVVADDITGANDIGIMFAKSNYVTDVFPYDESISFSGSQPYADVVILDTNSRFDDSKTAYKKVYKATKELQRGGVTHFYNKTCSVFRGNIGIEFDAMLDALEEDFAIVVVGFPKNGRQTIDGIHYVYGNRLENSEFRNDPMHPMNDSSLIDILKAQTKRKVGSIHYNVIQKGHKALQLELTKIKKQCNYVILDVTTQDDLITIAKATKDVKVFCGSSALAEELPKTWSEEKNKSRVSLNLPRLPARKGMFSVAGSLMPQTANQIEYLREKGMKIKELRTLHLIEAQEQTSFIQALLSDIMTNLNDGSDVLLHTSNDKETVKQTKESALKKGVSNKELSQFISRTLADITATVLHETGQNRLLVAGGDTSAAVCSKINIRGMRVWKEIEPGLPSCISLSEPPLLLVLKSGSFGKPNFFEQAITHLKSE